MQHTLREPRTAPASHFPPPAEGDCPGPRRPCSGRLSVHRIAGRSRATSLAFTSPLRLLAPDFHTRSLLAFTSTLGGGLVSGDDIDLTVDITGDAHLALTTQSAGKAYPARQHPARPLTGTAWTTNLHLPDPGGIAVLWPDPLICFAGSHHHQTAHLKLNSLAGAVWLETVVAGRVASGEAWSLGRYFSRGVVEIDGTCVCDDRLALHGSPSGDRPAGVGHFDCYCTLGVAGAAVFEVAQALGDLLDSTATLVSADVLCTRSTFPGGVMGRFAATSVSALNDFISPVLAAVTSVLQLDPTARRF